MRGHGFRNVVAENINALASLSNAQHNMSVQKRLCWKCQKDKYTKGGHIKTFAGGHMKFICSECKEKT
jgi:hypothetical protein